MENKELAEALKTWHNTTIDPDAGEEREAELVRTQIEKRGVILKLLDNDDDLRSAVQLWNEKNKNLGEYSTLLHFIDINLNYSVKSTLLGAEFKIRPQICSRGDLRCS